MIEALKEYNEMVWKPSCKWLGRHWKGYSVFVAVLTIVPYLWFYWSDITEYIRSKLAKDEGES